MKIWTVTIVMLLAMTSLAMAQMTGTVAGTVYDEDNNPVEGAYVHLTGEGWHGGGHHGGGHNCGDNYYTLSDSDGNFTIEEVSPDAYTAMASKMGLGHDAHDIEVVGGETTTVDFVLEMGGHGWGGGCDSLEIVELSGWAIVEQDSFYTHYYLDTENDGEADYRLGFGPEWYDPGNGAERPNDGDSIWVVGGLMGYSQPQMVVVYEINGLFWREPGDGHGGYGGHGGDDGGCNPDSLDLVDVSGLAMVWEMNGNNIYFLDENYDESAEYRLNFGAPWYDPGNGATRPDDGDTVSIVGGLMDGCENWPVIIVYEINGMFWRDPGDTTGLWLLATAVDSPEDNVIPRKILAASNYPNPFNPSTVISFAIDRQENVRVSVFDLLGRRLAVLADRVFPAGENNVVFDPAQSGGSSSAVYFYRVETESAVATGKMVMLK